MKYLLELYSVEIAMLRPKIFCRYRFMIFAGSSTIGRRLKPQIVPALSICNFVQRHRLPKNPEDLATLLNKSVQDLREEIETLKLHCQHIRTLAQPSEPANDVWRTAVEYFRLIRHGLRLDSNQLGFMRNTMAPDVVFNAEYGPEVIMQHWFFVD
ncbi:hypothetical protein JG688_00008317 [Phytophthora aleatoria]|uniref:Uncharacterized protein n=1 Tax=Phytophthora aleatoria TaxID=2496075 RepID=A0A8J5IR88_9STRA|nr:hypothetical protein JG688_00008317 [Phytophthora aleatoria]